MSEPWGRPPACPPGARRAETLSTCRGQHGQGSSARGGMVVACAGERAGGKGRRLRRPAAAAEGLQVYSVAQPHRRRRGLRLVRCADAGSSLTTPASQRSGQRSRPRSCSRQAHPPGRQAASSLSTSDIASGRRAGRPAGKRLRGRAGGRAGGAHLLPAAIACTSSQVSASGKVWPYFENISSNCGGTVDLLISSAAALAQPPATRILPGQAGLGWAGQGGGGRARAGDACAQVNLPLLACILLSQHRRTFCATKRPSVSHVSLSLQEAGATHAGSSSHMKQWQ